MNVETPKSLNPGEARSEGPSVQEYLDQESVAVPEVLRRDVNVHMGSEDLDTSRWTGRDFAEQELEKMWSRVWQFACREEHIPEIGDHIVENGDPDNMDLSPSRNLKATEVRNTKKKSQQVYRSAHAVGGSAKQGSRQ